MFQKITLVLVIAGVVVRVALRSEPGRVVAAEVATKSPGEAPRYSSGEEGSVTKKSSSEKESSRYSSGGPVGQQEEDAKEPQAVLQQEAEPPNSRSETPEPADQQTPSEVPSEPEPKSQQHQPHPEEQFLPGSEHRGWPEPTKQS